jgi:ketosteroid isomerase-like protein
LTCRKGERRSRQDISTRVDCTLILMTAVLSFISTWFVTILLLLVALLPRDIIAQVASTDAAEITAAVEGFHRAVVHGDRAAALALLAPDAAILESGHLQTRAEYEHEHLGEDIAFAGATTAERSPLKIQQEDNVAWTTGTSKTTGTFNGRKIGSRGVELMVLTKTESGWRIRAIHWSSHDSK